MRYPDQFALRMLYLVVQAAKHALHRFGMVVLNERDRPTYNLFKHLLIEAFVEKSPLIAENLRLEKNNIRNRKVSGFHCCGISRYDQDRLSGAAGKKSERDRSAAQPLNRRHGNRRDYRPGTTA